MEHTTLLYADSIEFAISDTPDYGAYSPLAKAIPEAASADFQEENLTRLNASADKSGRESATSKRGNLTTKAPSHEELESENFELLLSLSLVPS